MDSIVCDKMPWFHGNDDDHYAGIPSFCVMDLKNAILSLFLNNSDNYDGFSKEI